MENMYTKKLFIWNSKLSGHIISLLLFALFFVFAKSGNPICSPFSLLIHQRRKERSHPGELNLKHFLQKRAS